MKKQYGSKILKSLHEEAQELFKIGVIDKKKMEEFDRDCLVQEKPCKPVKTPKRPQCAAVTIR